MRGTFHPLKFRVSGKLIAVATLASISVALGRMAGIDRSGHGKQSAAPLR